MFRVKRQKKKFLKKWKYWHRHAMYTILWTDPMRRPGLLKLVKTEYYSKQGTMSDIWDNVIGDMGLSEEFKTK